MATITGIADKLTRRHRSTLAWVIENWPYPYRGSPKSDMDDLVALGLVRPYTEDEWGGPTALGKQVWKHARLEWIEENDLGAAFRRSGMNRTYYRVFEGKGVGYGRKGGEPFTSKAEATAFARKLKTVPGFEHAKPVVREVDE